jgi:O-antigen/teichoic acid export membrane protein
VVSFGFETAVLRGYFAASSPDARRTYVSSAAVFVLAAAAAGALVAIAVVTPLARSVDVPAEYFVLGIAGGAIYVGATAVPLAVLRARRALGRYVAVNAAYVVTLTVAMLVLVVGMEKGAAGWFVAGLVAAFAALIVAGAALRDDLTSRLAWAPVAAALAIGLPLVPHALAHWGLSLSDRILLAHWVPMQEVGTYSIAYQLAGALGLVFIAVNHSVMSDFGAAVADAGRRAHLPRMVTYQVALTIFAGSVVALAGPAFVDRFLPAGWSPAADLVPALALANVIFGLYLIPMNIVAILAGQTRWIWLATVFAAGANVVTNVLLIPVWGAEGAAAGTVVGYVTLFAVVAGYMLWRHGALLHFEWKRLFVAAAGSSVVLAVAAGLGVFDREISAAPLAVAIAALAAVAAIAAAPSSRRTKAAGA